MSEITEGMTAQSKTLSGDIGTEMEQEHTPVSPGDIGGSAEVAQEHTQALSSSAGMASSPVASTESAKDEMDLLHPLVSWEWEPGMEAQYSSSPDAFAPVTCFNENLYFLYGNILRCIDGVLKLTRSTCPAYNSTLATYQGKLVLVGGRLISDHSIRSQGFEPSKEMWYCSNSFELDEDQCRDPYTNKIWSLQKNLSWAEELPPMTAKRSGAAVLSIGEHLFVAGGGDREAVKETVEVFDGERWLRTLSPHVLLWKSASIFLKGMWYVKGERDIVFARVDTLIAKAGKMEAALDLEHDAGENVWMKLPGGIPRRIVAFRDYILALGDTGDRSIYAHINSSWLHVADLPQGLKVPSLIPLPSGELAVVGELKVAGVSKLCMYIVSLKVDSFHQGRLSIAAINRLEIAVRVPLFWCISAELAQFARFLQMEVYRSPVSDEQGMKLIQMWLSKGSSKPATWQSLVAMLASVKELASLSEKVKGFLTQREEKFIDLSKEIEDFQAISQTKRGGGEGAKIDGLERAEEGGEEGKDSVSSLKKQLQGIKETNKMLGMKLNECQEEVQKVVAETDAALQKIEEIKAQLAVAHQREASTDIAVSSGSEHTEQCKKVSAAKRKRTSGDGGSTECKKSRIPLMAESTSDFPGIGAEMDKELRTPSQAEAHQVDASAVSTDERNTTKPLIAPVAEGTTSVLCDRPTLRMLLDFPGSINIPERIGTKYLMFGTLLLKDDNGDRVQAIVSKYKDDVMNINFQILIEWVQGNGIPCTWDDLICILKKCCNTLAVDIEKRLH